MTTTDRTATERATPLVRRLAADLGVTLADCEHTGTGGRITADDVRRAARRDLCAQLWPTGRDQHDRGPGTPGDTVDQLWPPHAG